MRLRHVCRSDSALLLRCGGIIYAVHQQQAALPKRWSALPQERSNPMSAARTVLSRFRAYLRYRDTVQQLSRLSDRELADLGISRYEINGIARV